MLTLSTIVTVLLSFGQILNPSYKLIEARPDADDNMSARIVSVKTDDSSTKVVIEYSASKKTKFSIPKGYTLAYKEGDSYVLMSQKSKGKESAASKKSIKAKSSILSEVEFPSIPEDIQTVDVLNGPSSLFNFVEVDLTKDGIEGSQVAGTVNEEEIYTRASFFGMGPDGFPKWVDTQLKYPEESKEKGREGTVLLQVIVESDGSASAKLLKRSKDKYLDEEALRVANMSPAWSPFRIRGVPQKIRYTFPVIFKLKKD